MDDPYRGHTQVGTCPRCGNSTEGDGEKRLVCVRGCGEWYPRENFTTDAWQIVAAGGAGVEPQPWPFEAAKCPMCSRDMKVGYRKDLRYDYCGQHGLWLDAGEVHRFTQAFQPT